MQGLTRRTAGVRGSLSAALAAGAALAFATAAEPAALERIPGCTRVAADWADGDSFPVRSAAGRDLTIRLYGVDCFEWHVRDDTDARRLRSQRRWFGIADVGAAKQVGAAAAREVAVLLERPFTVHTSHADGRGDARFNRIYAFVTSADGQDLGAVLVARGLARAYGVCRSTPDGRSQDEYREHLRDLELQAAKRGLGGWALTDWARLPEERRLAREEEAEFATARGDGPVDEHFVIDPNSAARDELMRLPGIGETLANRIIEARPFGAVDDLGRVPGIGPGTLARIRPHLRLAGR